MTSLQARVCTWACKALESVLCKLFGHFVFHPTGWPPRQAWCARCGKML